LPNSTEDGKVDAETRESNGPLRLQSRERLPAKYSTKPALWLWQTAILPMVSAGKLSGGKIMDKRAFLTKILLEAKRDGKLKPQYQAMTDEEMLEDFFRSVEEGRMKRLQNNSEAPVQEETQSSKSKVGADPKEKI